MVEKLKKENKSNFTVCFWSGMAILMLTVISLFILVAPERSFKDHYFFATIVGLGGFFSIILFLIALVDSISLSIRINKWKKAITSEDENVKPAYTEFREADEYIRELEAELAKTKTVRDAKVAYIETLFGE